MPQKILFAIFSVLFLSGFATAQTVDPVCAKIDASPGFSRAIAYLGADNSAPPVFGQFSIGRVTTVILDTSVAPNCAVISKGGSIVARVPLAKPFMLANGLYDFYRTEAPTNPDVADFREHAGLNFPQRFIIFDVGSPQMKQMMIQMAADHPEITWTNNALLGLFTHESFHLYVQFSTTYGPSAPKGRFSTDLGRDGVQSKCYDGTPEIKAAYLKERAAILESFRMTRLANGPRPILSALRDFIAAREERRDLAKDVRIVDESSNTEGNCATAEANLEALEGTPEYIGMSSVLDRKMLSTDELIAYFPLEDNASFYRLGLFELLALRSLVAPAEFQRLLKTLNETSADQMSIYGVLKTTVSSASTD